MTMLIREILALKEGGELYSAEPAENVEAAVQRMVKHNIGSLVVLEGGVMVGYLTERDIIHGLAQRGSALGDVRVSQLMNKEPFIAGPEDTVDYARDAMTKNRISHLVVMDGNRLAGVISLHDIARAALKYAHYENALLKRYIKHWPE